MHDVYVESLWKLSLGSLCLLSGFTLTDALAFTEEKRDAPKGGETNQSIYKTTGGTCSAAEKGSDNVEAEETNRAPIEAADNR